MIDIPTYERAVETAGELADNAFKHSMNYTREGIKLALMCNLFTTFILLAIILLK